MSAPGIIWSEKDQQFYVKDGGDVLWFDSILDAKDAVHGIELRQAVDAERAAAVAWLRQIGKRQLADAIEAGEHLK